MFVLQSLQVYLTNLDTSVGVIMMENDPPRSLETCIGTVLSCRNKVDISELSFVRFLLFSDLSDLWDAREQVQGEDLHAAEQRRFARNRAAVPQHPFQPRRRDDSQAGAQFPRHQLRSLPLPLLTSRPLCSGSQCRRLARPALSRGNERPSSLPNRHFPRGTTLPWIPPVYVVPPIPRGQSAHPVPWHSRGSPTGPYLTQSRGSRCESLP